MIKKQKLKNIIALIVIISILFSLASCAAVKSYKKYSYEFFGTFDTVITLSGYAQSQKEFDEYSSYAFKRFNELHKLFDNYNTYEGINNIKTINDSSGNNPVKVDSEIINLLEFSIDSYKSISPQTDISLGALLSVWHDYREAGLEDPENAQAPPEDELISANSFTGIDNIIIDKTQSTVHLEQGTLIDLGAVAKGYATELVANELYDMGFESFLISSGGNVKAVGTKFDKEKSLWSIGILNPYYYDSPEDNENLIDIAYLSDMSVVTSGDYQRFYVADGITYHHLIDPDTLYPAQHFRSVTIFAQNSAVADFLSTAVFLSTYEEGLTLIKSLERVEAYWVLYDGTVAATDGVKEMLESFNDSAN